MSKKGISAGAAAANNATTGRADSARTSASVNQPIVQQIVNSIENRISQAQAVNKENNNIIAETGNFTGKYTKKGKKIIGFCVCVYTSAN